MSASSPKHVWSRGTTSQSATGTASRGVTPRTAIRLPDGVEEEFGMSEGCGRLTCTGTAHLHRHARTDAIIRLNTLPSKPNRVWVELLACVDPMPDSRNEPHNDRVPLGNKAVPRRHGRG